MQHNLVTRPDAALFPGLIQPLLTFIDSFQAYISQCECPTTVPCAITLQATKVEFNFSTI